MRESDYTEAAMARAVRLERLRVENEDIADAARAYYAARMANADAEPNASSTIECIREVDRTWAELVALVDPVAPTHPFGEES